MMPPADPPAPKPPPAPRRGRAAFSLRPGQIVLAIGVLLLIAGPLVCGYFITSLYRSEVAAIRNRLEIPTHAMAHLTRGVVRNADRMLRNIDEGLRTTDRERFAAAAVGEIARYRNGSTSPAISRVAIYDLNGMAINGAAATDSAAGYDFFRRQTAATSDAVLVSDLVRDPATGKAAIVFSRRLVDRSGVLRGVAAVFLDPDYLQSIFDSLQMPAGTSITVFNRDGHVVLRTPAVRLGDPDLKVEFSRGPIFQAFRDGSATGSFVRFKTFQGIDRFAAGIGGNDATFIIAAGWDSNAALAAWRRASLALVGGTAIALALVLALLVYLRRQIRRNDLLLAKVSGAEQRQRNLIAALPEAVAIVNERLEIEFANSAAERLYGYGPGEMDGLALTAVTPALQQAADKEGARLFLRTDDPNATVRTLRRMAERKDGTEFPVEISTCRYAGPDGLKLISIIRDVTQREANDMALQRSRENLARAQRMAALGSFDRELGSGALECSEEFLRIWGFPPGSVASLATLVERVHPRDRESFVATRVAVLSGRKMPKSEFRIIRPDGEERILYHEYSADFRPDGRPLRSFGIVQDITERKLNELALSRSRENLARAQRVASVGSFEHDVATGRGEWSDEFLRIWGIEEMPPPDGNSHDFLLSRVHPEDRQKFIEGREAALRDEPVPVDFRIVRPNGEIRDVHAEYRVTLDDQGRPSHLFGTVQDVTERKKIESELRRSREDLARAQQVAALGSFSRDLATGKVEWSDEFLRVWGMTDSHERPHAELLAQLVHPADREAFLQGRDAAIQRGSNMALDFRITRPDGEERILHREYGVVFDENGNAVRMFGTVQDITERKRIEIELRRNEENLEHSQRIAGLGSFERDLVTGKWAWSDELYRIHGVDRNDPHVDVAYLRSLVHPEDGDSFDELRYLAAAGITMPPRDVRIIRPDGVERILHRECELVRDADGKPLRLVATLQDITERRKAELELRRSRENLARAQRLAAIGSFERDLVIGKSEWSDELYRIYGIEKVPDQPPQPEDMQPLIHPDDRERFRKMRADELAGIRQPPFEYRIIRRDGVERIVRRESAVTLDAEKRPIRVFGTVQDITERKRAEIEIIESRENLMRAQRIANMGSFDYDLAAGRVEWSDQMYRITGLEKDKIALTPNVMLELVHPDDREAFIAARHRTRRLSVDKFEFRIVRPDGEERYVRRENDVLFAEDGQPTRIFGTLQDVTERRLAEARERDLERQLLHSQKLEALGTLAGGIAHDLNNTLVPIMALSKLTAKRFEAGTPVRANLDTIYEASERARDLVRRVLAFSRKDEPEQQESNLADVVREALKLMRATVPSSIQIADAIEDVPPIRADASQIHQVITNLVSNAAGAMTNSMGMIAVTLGLTAPGKGPREVCLSVSDNGCGMDEATQQRIFEPFFTTKSVGQGTGLGLSIVHGIIASHNGHIEVKSAPGKGTRFDLYFPLPKPSTEAVETSEPDARSSRPAA